MNQISTLKSIIREAIQEMELDEMARIASMFELADNYMEALAMIDNRGLRNSIKTENIINHLNKVGQDTIQGTANALGYSERQAINQHFQALVNAGVIKSLGLEREKAEKPVSSGIKGRPAVFNKDILNTGASVIKKYAKGDTNYTEEELAFIKALYSSFH